MKILAIEKELPNISSNDFKTYLKTEALRVWEHAAIILEWFVKTMKVVDICATFHIYIM